MLDTGGNECTLEVVIIFDDVLEVAFHDEHVGVMIYVIFRAVGVVGLESVVVEGGEDALEFVGMVCIVAFPDRVSSVVASVQLVTQFHQYHVHRVGRFSFFLIFEATRRVLFCIDIVRAVSKHMVWCIAVKTTEYGQRGWLLRPGKMMTMMLMSCSAWVLGVPALSDVTDPCGDVTGIVFRFVQCLVPDDLKLILVMQQEWGLKFGIQVLEQEVL